MHARRGRHLCWWAGVLVLFSLAQFLCHSSRDLSRYITLPHVIFYVTSRYLTLPFTLHHVTSRYLLRYITLPHVTFYVTSRYLSRYVTLHHFTSLYLTFHHVTSRYITLPHVTFLVFRSAPVTRWSWGTSTAPSPPTTSSRSPVGAGRTPSTRSVGPMPCTTRSSTTARGCRSSLPRSCYMWEGINFLLGTMNMKNENEK